MKGNDHQCSLDIDEFAEMVKSIRTMEVALGGPMKRFQKCEEECFKKLGKCLLANKELKKGNTITELDLCIKVSFSMPIFPTVFSNINQFCLHIWIVIFVCFQVASHKRGVWRPQDINKVIGKVCKKDISKDELIMAENIAE